MADRAKMAYGAVSLRQHCPDQVAMILHVP
jgi:hypothetical protein